jgi:hypothetical protein
MPNADRLRVWRSAHGLHSGAIARKISRCRVSDITPTDVARLVAEMQRAGHSGWTIAGVLATLSLIGRKARVRNPVATAAHGNRTQRSYK